MEERRRDRRRPDRPGTTARAACAPRCSLRRASTCPRPAARRSRGSGCERRSSSSRNRRSRFWTLYSRGRLNLASVASGSGAVRRPAAPRRQRIGRSRAQRALRCVWRAHRPARRDLVDLVPQAAAQSRRARAGRLRRARSCPRFRTSVAQRIRETRAAGGRRRRRAARRSGPAPCANVSSTNHGSVRASSFKTPPRAASPSSRTNSFQRAGSARNAGTDNGDERELADRRRRRRTRPSSVPPSSMRPRRATTGRPRA